MTKKDTQARARRTSPPKNQILNEIGPLIPQGKYNPYPW